MKKMICSELALTVFLLAGSVGLAQPWSVAATNSLQLPPPPQSWSNVATAAAPVPAVSAPPRPTPPPASPALQLSNIPLPAGILALDGEQKEYTAKPDEPKGL
jgi:hypothetical protein